MNTRKLVPVLLIAGVLAAAGVAGAAVVGFDPVSPVVADLAGAEDSKPSALVGFESAGAQCTDDFRANSSTSIVGGANTEITHARNLSLPDPSYAVGDPAFERLNESAYALRVPTEATEKAARDCPGVARYEAQMRIPAGDDPWTVFVYHDGERVATLFGESDSSVLGGSAKGGQRVSD